MRFTKGFLTLLSLYRNQKGKVIEIKLRKNAFRCLLVLIPVLMLTPTFLLVTAKQRAVTYLIWVLIRRQSKREASITPWCTWEEIHHWSKTNSTGRFQILYVGMQ